jgi:hypothetical protein
MKRSQTGGRRSRSYQYVGVRPVPQEAVVESSADRRVGWRALSHEKRAWRSLATPCTDNDQWTTDGYLMNNISR